MQGVENRGNVCVDEMGEGIYGSSVFSAQFFCKLELL